MLELFDDQAQIERDLTAIGQPTFFLECFSKGWGKYSAYADLNFRKKVNYEFNRLCKLGNAKDEYVVQTNRLVELWWEMSLALDLLDLGLNLVPTSDRKLIENRVNLDHLVKIGGKRIWIECTSPSKGIHSGIPELHEVDGGFSVPTEKMKLRISQSIFDKASKSKKSQISKFRSEYPEYGDDLFLIAVNTANLTWDTPRKESRPLAFGALYGTGSDVYSIPRKGDGEAKFVGAQHIPSVEKSSTETLIEMEGFIKGDYAQISGVLSSRSSPFSTHHSIQLILNATATSVLPLHFTTLFECWSFDLESQLVTRKAAGENH